MKNFGLGSIDVKKILVHFAVYVLAYAGVAAVLFVMKLNFGVYNQVIQLLGGLVIDTLRKLGDGQIE